MLNATTFFLDLLILISAILIRRAYGVQLSEFFLSFSARLQWALE
jgi:hypothetical protein